MTRSLCGCILMLTIAAAPGCADWRPRIPVRSVFVPKQDIPPGMKVANVAALFELQEFAADSLPVDVIDDPNKLQDMVCLRTLKARQPFTARDLISIQAVFRDGDRTGYRALTIVGEQTPELMGSVTPGFRMDVIAVHPDADDPSKMDSYVLLQKAEVLAIHASVNPGPAVRNPMKVTLAVTPKDFELAVAIGEKASLILHLHYPDRQWLPVPKAEILPGTSLDERRLFEPGRFDAKEVPNLAMKFGDLNGRVAARKLTPKAPVTSSDLE